MPADLELSLPHARLVSLVTEALLLADMNGFTEAGIHLDAVLVAIEKRSAAPGAHAHASGPALLR